MKYTKHLYNLQKFIYLLVIIHLFILNQKLHLRFLKRAHSLGTVLSYVFRTRFWFLIRFIQIIFSKWTKNDLISLKMTSNDTLLKTHFFSTYFKINLWISWEPELYLKFWIWPHKLFENLDFIWNLAYSNISINITIWNDN